MSKNCFQVHCLLRDIPVHPPLGGDHHHLHQDLLLPEEEEDAKPDTGEKAKEDKHNPDVHIPHIFYQVQKYH